VTELAKTAAAIGMSFETVHERPKKGLVHGLRLSLDNERREETGNHC